MYCVYVHINKINNKIYVGQSKNIKSKWGGPVAYKTSTLFYKAIQKYGWNNFEHEIVASNLTKEEADNFESLLIEKLNTRNPDFGYNVTPGGNKWFGKDNPNFGNKTLHKKYKENKDLAKEKQSRPRGQNGRAIKTKLYTIDGKFIKTFDCRRDMVDYLKSINVIPKHYSDSVIFYLKRKQGYKGYKIQ